MSRILAALLSVAITGGCADEEIVRLEKRSGRQGVDRMRSFMLLIVLLAGCHYSYYRSGNYDHATTEVLKVAESEGVTYVLVSIEDRPGVLAGDQVHLTRDTAYVGRITVLDIRGDKAFARADTRWIGVAWPPRPGDRAWVE